jgi:hypothetical protein
MKKSIQFIILISLIGISFTFNSCSKDDHNHDDLGHLNIQTQFVFGADMLPFALNQKMMHTKTFDSLTFSEFSFYISNIRLQKEDGTWWNAPESYHLLSAKSADDAKIHLHEVPAGNYKAMEYTLGVDSLRNVSGAQTGDLAISKGMFWDWNSGYIMLKAEGMSPQSSTGSFAFHLGGFSGANNIVTIKTTDFNGSILTLTSSSEPTVVLLANPARLWHSSPSVATRSTIHMPGANAVTMAKDFYNNFSFKEIK